MGRGGSAALVVDCPCRPLDVAIGACGGGSRGLFAGGSCCRNCCLSDTGRRTVTVLGDGAIGV